MGEVFFFILTISFQKTGCSIKLKETKKFPEQHDILFEFYEDICMTLRCISIFGREYI